MKTRTAIRASLGAFVGLALTAASADAASILVNGDFQTRDLSKMGGLQFGNFRTFQSDAFEGWTRSGSVQWAVETLGRNGSFGINVSVQSTNNPMALSQTFPTMIGTAYDVSYWIAKRSGGTADLTVSAGATSVTHLIADFTAGGAYVEQTWNFIATSTTTTLTFTPSGTFANNDNGWYLDDVAVMIPEPATTLLGGVGMLLMLRRRR